MSYTKEMLWDQNLWGSVWEALSVAEYPYNGGLVHNLVRLPVNMFSLVTGIREKRKHKYLCTFKIAGREMGTGSSWWATYCPRETNESGVLRREKGEKADPGLTEKDGQ